MTDRGAGADALRPLLALFTGLGGFRQRDHYLDRFQEAFSYFLVRDDFIVVLPEILCRGEVLRDALGPPAKFPLPVDPEVPLRVVPVAQFFEDLFPLAPRLQEGVLPRGRFFAYADAPLMEQIEYLPGQAVLFIVFPHDEFPEGQRRPDRPLFRVLRSLSRRIRSILSINPPFSFFPPNSKLRALPSPVLILRQGSVRIRHYPREERGERRGGKGKAAGG